MNLPYRKKKGFQNPYYPNMGLTNFNPSMQMGYRNIGMMPQQQQQTNMYNYHMLANYMQQPQNQQIKNQPRKNNNILPNNYNQNYQNQLYQLVKLDRKVIMK